MRPSELRKEVKKVFQSTEYPGDDSIVINTDIYQENYEMWLEFKGDWRNVSPQVVEDYRMSFMMLTAEGFRYYLPALLLAALHPFPYEVDEWLLYSLALPSDDTKRKEFDNKMNMLTSSQKKVVQKFVIHFMEENPLFADRYQKTLEYWKD